MSRVVSFFRLASQVFASRWTRAFLAVAALIWTFNALIFWITQRSFFASVGLESWFWRDLGAQVTLFGAFFGICLGLSRLFLGALTRNSPDDSPPLRGILAQLEPLRARVSRLSWALAIVFALVLSRELARHSLDWILLRNGARAGFTSFGLDAALWTHFLPLFEPFLRAVWKFSLALGILLLATGVLRALPLLAARNAAPPQLAAVLWRFGAWLWLLRALLYIVQILDLNRGRAVSSGDLWVLAPLWALGALACFALCAAFLRRAIQSTRQSVLIAARAKPSKLVWSALGALLLPLVASALSAPIRAFLPETPFLKNQREAAMRAAWQLPVLEESAAEKTAISARTPDEVGQIWPVWDAPTLLASRGGAVRSASRLVLWQSASLGRENQRWSAFLVGDSAGASALNSTREAESSNALALQRLELRGEKWVEAAFSPAAPLFFGLESRALSGQNVGVSLAPIGLKWAWAWRLRDWFLPFDTQNSSHLLVFRGARERAQILAPFFRAMGQPQLVFTGKKSEWSLDLCATTPNFPGAPPLSAGELAGANSASPLQMRLDARSGSVRFVAPRREAENSAWLDSWRAAFPEIASENVVDSPEIGKANPAFLSAQATVSLSARGQTAQISAPQIGFDVRNGPIWSVLAIGKNSFEIWQGARGASSVLRGVGDLRARLAALDSAVAQQKTQNGAPQNSAAQNSVGPDYRAGEPFVWRDARAPGGFWVARGFFAPLPATQDAAQIAARGPFLWRVAVAGSAQNARVGVANSLRAAYLLASGQVESRPPSSATVEAPLNSKPPQKMKPAPAGKGAPLEIVALRTHEELQAAVKRGDWKAFGALAARETELLKRLAAQRSGEARSGAAQSDSTKNPTETLAP